MTVVSSAARGRVARVLTGQILVKFALFMTFTAMTAVVLPAAVARLDPVGKVATLAAIATIGAIVNALTQPVVGVLSDRTRSAWGRRIPWMLGGALVGGLAVGAIGGAPTILLVAVLWPLAQLGLNGVEAPLDAYLVDEFPPERRGNAAGVVGLALVVGTSAGALIAGALIARPSVVTWLLAGGVALAVLAFTALVRDADVGAAPRPRRPIGDLLRAATATARAHPDFTRVLVWRVGYSIAYGAVFSYLLYILTDHIGVGTDEAGRVIGLATILAGLASAITVVASGWLSDRVGRRRVFVLVGNGVLVAGDLLLLAAPVVSVALVAAVLFGVGLGLSISCGRALASQVLPDPRDGAATGLGVLSTAASIGQAAAPAIAAAAIGVAGYPGVFVTSILGALGCSVAIGLVRSVR